jgi:arylsulfatase
MGYDELRESRMAGAIREGVVPAGSVSVKNTPGLKPWLALTPDEQAGYVARMDAYAAMIDGVDQNVGRLLAFLQARGDLENILIVFMSDNGAEGHAIEELPRIQDWVAENFDNTPANIGQRNSYVTIGQGWARAAAAPFRLSKGRISEGGIRVPAFVHFPGENSGRIDDAYMTVMDLAPTFMEIAGGSNEEQYRGRSLLPRLRGGEQPVHPSDETISFEVYGRRAVQRGPWKLLSMEVPYGTGEWELHNLENDPGEQVDVAPEFPEIVEQLSAAWESYAAEVGVIMPEHPIAY